MRSVQFGEEGNPTDAIVISVSPSMTGITQYGLVCSGKLQLELWMIRGDG